MNRIGDALASALRAGREDFNAQFVRARHQYPTLSAAVFADFLVTGVDPVVRAVAEVAPDQIMDTATAAYGIGLELVARNLVGPGAKHADILRAWQGLLPLAGTCVAAAPRRVLSAVSNAVHQLAATPGARPGWWLEEMTRLVSVADGAETFLRLGQIVAWRAGMAHFRPGALAIVDTLSEPLARTVMGLTDGNAPLPWPEFRARLETDPWYDPVSGDDAKRPPASLAARAGGFRGFGGLFAEPPTVAGGQTGQFFVRSGDGCWLLTADAFGATFHRAMPEEFASAASRPVALPKGVSLDFGGVLFRRERVALPFCGEITSHAANGSTLAVTGSLTHAVMLIAVNSFSPA